MTGQRGLRVALLLSTLALVGSFAAIASVAFTNNSRIDDIQESRRENTAASCELANGQNRAIIEFVVEVSGGSARMKRLVHSRFPVRNDCRAYARGKVR